MRRSRCSSSPPSPTTGMATSRASATWSPTSGRLLDPLADKLLLVATLVPMYMLQRHYAFISPLEGVLPEPSPFLFVTPFGRVSLPRLDRARRDRPRSIHDDLPQVASRRGLVISCDRAGQVEDDLPEHLDRRRVLLVLRAHARGRQGLARSDLVAIFRACERPDGHVLHGGVGGAHSLFACAVPHAVRAGVSPGGAFTEVNAEVGGVHWGERRGRGGVGGRGGGASASLCALSG